MVVEYNEVVRCGAFDRDLRLELLDAQVFDRSPICSRHAAKVDLLNEFLTTGLRRAATIRVRGPVKLSERSSEPVSDLTVLQRRHDYYEQSHPGPDDIRRSWRYSDTAVYLDRTIKRRLYAAGGIRELWIVDLAAGVVEVATDPEAGYATTRMVRPGNPLSPDRVFPSSGSPAPICYADRLQPGTWPVAPSWAPPVGIAHPAMRRPTRAVGA